MTKEQELERQIIDIVNMDLDIDDDGIDNSAPGQKFYIPGSELLIGYLLSEISNFLLSEVVDYIKEEIRDNTIEYGIKLIAFHIFEYLFKQQSRVNFVQGNLPTFLRVLSKHAKIFPNISITSINSDPNVIIQDVRSQIMESDKPFKVDVNAIIEFHEMNNRSVQSSKSQPVYQELNETRLRHLIRNSIKEKLF